jgi:hypothetical protein
MHGLRLRQICLVARDQQKVVEDFATLLDMRPVHGSCDLTRFGLPAKGPMFQGGHFMLDALGVENLVFAAGSDFVEVLSPIRAEGSAVRLMERRRGDTGYMIILQADDVESYVRLGDQQGIRVVHQSRFPDYRDVHFHPKDTGGALLSVARHVPDNLAQGPWYPAGTAWRQLPRSRVVAGLAAAELQSDDPETMALRWGRLLDRPVERVGEHYQILLEDGALRFMRATDGRGDGFAGFDLRVSGDGRHGTSTLDVSGMRVRLEPQRPRGNDNQGATTTMSTVHDFSRAHAIAERVTEFICREIVPRESEVRDAAHGPDEAASIDSSMPGGHCVVSLDRVHVPP